MAFVFENCSEVSSIRSSHTWFNALTPLLQVWSKHHKVCGETASLRQSHFAHQFLKSWLFSQVVKVRIYFE